MAREPKFRTVTWTGAGARIRMMAALGIFSIMAIVAVADRAGWIHVGLNNLTMIYVLPALAVLATYATLKYMGERNRPLMRIDRHGVLLPHLGVSVEWAEVLGASASRAAEEQGKPRLVLRYRLPGADIEERELLLTEADAGIGQLSTWFAEYGGIKLEET